MKIKNEYPNFINELLFFIGDKNPVLVSNDSIKISYYIPLRNFKRGFDYYELTRHKSGGVYFTLVTMLGLKTVLQTDSEMLYSDLNGGEWNDLIHKITMTHFGREEYIALKKGYVKKGGSGCMLSILILLIMSISIGLAINI